MTAQAIPVSFDVNHRASLWKGRDEDAAAMERSMMKAADVLFASTADLTRALGHELTGGSRDAAEAAFKAFPRLRFLVSTRREATAANDQTFSVRVDSRGDAFETDLASVGPPLDRIGSGDAVAGAALDAIIRGASIREIARNALAAGLLKIGIAGDR
jgi:2-dehydro-3-deoxygluconokinase